MHAHRQAVGKVTGGIALVLWLAPLALGSAPASGAEYQLEGRVSYVSKGSNDEIDLTGAFQINQTFILSCKIDPSGMLPESSGKSTCTGCVTEMSFSVGSYRGTMQAGSLSLLQVHDNAPESGTTCGGLDPEIDEFIVIATGIRAPDVASTPIAYAGFGFQDCEAGAWASTNLPNTQQPLDHFENRLLILVFQEGSRIGTVYATIAQAVVPVAQASWGQLKTRYR